MDLIERYRGSLVGMAAGDALGTTVEFKPRGSFAPVETIVGGGPFGLKPGEWTDDTSMALCLAESLIEKSGFDAADQMERYRHWWREGHLSSNGRCFDIGVTVSGALHRFEQTGEPFSGSTDPNTAGNGSIMRLAPVPLFFRDDPKLAVEMAGESSRTTHGAAEAVDGCRYLAALIVGALGGADKQELLSDHFEPLGGLWSGAPLAPKIAEVAAGSFKRRRPPEIKGSGYVVRSLEAALWAFHGSENFREGALLAVNLGDDADTTTAVYGQLAGAYYGERGIPEEWRALLAKKELIMSLADRLHEAGAAARSPLPAASAGRAGGVPAAGRLARSSKAARTSDTDPIQVNFVAADDLKLPGRLGLTFAPGKKQPHGQSGHWDRDLDKDLTRLRAEFNADTLVSLIEEHEFERLKISSLRDRAKAAGIESLWFPIRDQSVPTSAEEFAALVDSVVGRLREGRTVVVHCMGGLGRTGLVAAACLVAATEMTPEEAVKAVRAARRGAVETPEQERYVSGFARSLRAGRPDVDAAAPTSPEVTPEQIDELLEFLPKFEEPGREFAVWKGGETDESGVMRMPHPAYDEDVYRFFELVAQKQWADYNYGDKAPHEILENPERIANASMEQIRAVLTYCARGERFGDGHWEYLLKEGKVAAVLRRLRSLRGDAGSDPGRGRGA